MVGTVEEKLERNPILRKNIREEYLRQHQQTVSDRESRKKFSRSAPMPSLLESGYFSGYFAEAYSSS